MFKGSSRVIYVANGNDPRVPQGNVVFVVTALKARFAGEPETEPLEGGESEYEYESEEEEAAAPAPARGREQEPDPEPEPERELTPEEAEEQRKADLKARMRRIGQPAGGLMMPMFPMASGGRAPARKADPEPSEVARASPAEAPRPSPFEIARAVAQETPPVRLSPSEPVKQRPRTLEERLDLLEETDRRLGSMLVPAGGFNPDAVIAGVGTLAGQVRTAQTQMDQLQRTLQEAQAKAGESAAASRQAETVRQELADAKKAGVALDRQVKENARKVRELEAQMKDAGDTARESATGLIKDMMDSVFQRMVRQFPADGRWTGAEIGDLLATLLKEQSSRTLAIISEKGLL
jgi:hypothetical protein